MNLPEDQGYYEAMREYADKKPQRVFTENLNTVEACRISEDKFALSKVMKCKKCGKPFNTATEVGDLKFRKFTKVSIFGKRFETVAVYPVVRLDKCPNH